MSNTKNPDFIVFADNSRYYIESSGKQQLDVALDLDVGRTTLNNWCTGVSMPKWSMIQRLASYFHVLPQMLTEERCVLTNAEQLSVLTKDFSDKQWEKLISYANFLLKNDD